MTQTGYFDNHKNVEAIIPDYLLFLPPKGSKSILDIGCGRTAPYSKLLKNRTKHYKSLDIRPGPKVDYVMDVRDLSTFYKDKFSIFEWGWCVETLEHVPPEDKELAAKEIMTVCQNCIFAYPKLEFKLYDKDGKLVNSFYHDKGHTEVKIDWIKLFGKTHNITDKSTKNGRAIFILKHKGWS